MYKDKITSFFQVTWIDHPNGGHVFTPERVTNKTPKKVTKGRTWKSIIIVPQRIASAAASN